MQHEIKKISKIVDELMTYFLKHNFNNIKIEVKHCSEQTKIRCIQDEVTYDEDFLGDLREVFNIQRQCEIEGYYWQLTGEIDEDQELMLVGSMIDEATVKMEGSSLFIELVRKNRPNCL